MPAGIGVGGNVPWGWVPYVGYVLVGSPLMFVIAISSFGDVADVVPR
jgi:hypothetical protein